MNDDVVCRGSLTLGNGCGQCQKCKAAAFDWLCHNNTALDYWAVMRTGEHNPMKAVIQAIRESKR